jgi:hypothetical protein
VARADQAPEGGGRPGEEVLVRRTDRPALGPRLEEPDGGDPERRIGEDRAPQVVGPDAGAGRGVGVVDGVAVAEDPVEPIQQLRVIEPAGNAIARAMPVGPAMRPGSWNTSPVTLMAADRSSAGSAERSPSISATPSRLIIEEVTSAATFGAKVLDAAPLWTMARSNVPRAAGSASRVDTLMAPADSPNTVTLPGSPPNAAMLSCTQRSAATWSSRPLTPLDE